MFFIQTDLLTSLPSEMTKMPLRDFSRASINLN